MSGNLLCLTGQEALFIMHFRFEKFLPGGHILDYFSSMLVRDART